MADCDRCGRPQHADTAYGCTSCAARADNALAAMPELLADLDDTIARRTASGIKRASGGEAHPLPIDAHAFAIKGELEATIIQWAWKVTVHHNTAPPRAPRPARLLPAPPPPPREEGPWCGHDVCWHPVCAAIRRQAQPRPREVEPGESRAHTAAVHLREHLEWLRHQPYAAEAFAAIEHAFWRARRTVDTAPERRYLGRCWEPVSETEACDAEVIAVVGAVSATCRSGRHVWDVAARYDWLLRESRAYLAPVAEISALLSILLGTTISRDTINSWIRRRQLARRGQGLDGVATYRLGDAIDLAVRAQAYKAKREAAAARAKAAAKKKAAAKASAKRAAKTEAAAKTQVEEVPA